MPDEPINITTDILIAIREDISLFRTSVEERFNEIDHRFKVIDERFDEIGERFDEIDERFNEIDKRFDEVDERFDRVEGRLDRVGKSSRRYRRDAAAMVVLMQATAGDFEERVSAVEERIAALEAARS